MTNTYETIFANVKIDSLLSRTQRVICRLYFSLNGISLKVSRNDIINSDGHAKIKQNFIYENYS